MLGSFLKMVFPKVGMEISECVELYSKESGLLFKVSTFLSILNSSLNVTSLRFVWNKLPILKGNGFNALLAVGNMLMNLWSWSCWCDCSSCFVSSLVVAIHDEYRNGWGG